MVFKAFLFYFRYNSFNILFYNSVQPLVEIIPDCSVLFLFILDNLVLIIYFFFFLYKTAMHLLTCFSPRVFLICFGGSSISTLILKDICFTMKIYFGLLAATRLSIIFSLIFSSTWSLLWIFSILVLCRVDSLFMTFSGFSSLQ